jgi:hypothetical protein
LQSKPIIQFVLFAPSPKGGIIENCKSESPL